MKRQAEILFRNTDINNVINYFNANKGVIEQTKNGLIGYFIEHNDDNTNKKVWIDFSQNSSQKLNSFHFLFTIYNKQDSKNFFLNLLKKASEKFEIEFISSFGVILNSKTLNQNIFFDDFFEEIDFTILSKNEIDEKNIVKYLKDNDIAIQKNDFKDNNLRCLSFSEHISSYNSEYLISMKNAYIQDLIDKFYNIDFEFDLFCFNLFCLNNYQIDQIEINLFEFF